MSGDWHGTAMSDGQAGPQTKGVAVELLATVDLGPEIDGMEGRQLRMRKVTIEPGGVFGPLHDHRGRPGTVFVLEGTITDHRDGTTTDYGPGPGWPAPVRRLESVRVCCPARDQSTEHGHTTESVCGRPTKSLMERCESGRIGLTANELTWETGSEGSNPSLSAVQALWVPARALAWAEPGGTPGIRRRQPGVPGFEARRGYRRRCGPICRSSFPDPLRVRIVGRSGSRSAGGLAAGCRAPAGGGHRRRRRPAAGRAGPPSDTRRLDIPEREDRTRRAS